ncbi:hypothetical protein EAF07_02940 [Streptococcus hillyeri]|uniref:Uncharacterized protein n=1 Tax=Streptococcus hillyeri TaxID=2282420 RepID=A0A3L9DVN9_9STRE|nr:hypothetical protein EAF07_02940 [Streptococcus hillyeri]
MLLSKTVRTLKRFGEPFEAGNEADKVSVKTSFGVSLLLFELRSQKVRYNQVFTLDYNTTMAKEALEN